MRVAFVINAREKSKHIALAVRSALVQTYSCEIILSDQGSTDGTYEIMEQEVADYYAHRGFYEIHHGEHTVKLVRCSNVGPYSMASMNAHFAEAWRQASPDCEYIFQCSGDDYSLPDRVRVCVDALEWIKSSGKDLPSAICTTMYFARPGETKLEDVSGYPRTTGFVSAGDGLLNLAYGSVIAGYSRSFLERFGSKAGPNTPDVFFGYLAALDKGFYVIANPQHCHVRHADTQNTGFQGKMLAASGDDTLRLAELNHLQLMRLYFACWEEAQDLRPDGMPQEAVNAIANMVIGQAKGLLDARLVLMEKNIAPGVL